MISRPTRRMLLGGVLAAATTCSAMRANAGSGVASIELILTETLLAVGEIPVAVGNRPLYERLVGLPALPPIVNDLGPLNEPNLELLHYLKPGLILAADWQRPTQSALAQIAPVEWLPTFAADGAPLANARALVRRIGTLTGRTQQAAALDDAFTMRILDLSRHLRPEPHRAVYVVRFMDDGRHLLVFGKGSLVDDVLRELGIENAWSGQTNMWGVAFAGLESLTGRRDALILHMRAGQDGNHMRSQSPLQRAVSRLAGPRLKRIAPVFPAGGLASALRLAEAVAAAAARASE